MPAERAHRHVADDRARLAQALAELADVQLRLEEESDRRAGIEALFDLVLDQMTDAVLLTDARGQVWRANAAASRLVGVPANALTGHTATELFGEACPATAWEVFEQSGDGRLPAFESRATTDQRGDVPISVSCSVLRDATGKVVGAVYAARDLSETEHLVHQLERAEGRWRLLAEVGDLLSAAGPDVNLAEVGHRLADAAAAPIAIIVVETSTVERVITWPPDDPGSATLGTLVGVPLDDRRTALWAAAREGRSVYSSTLAADFPLLPGDRRLEGARSAAVVPLASGDSRFGAVLVHAPEPRSVTEHTVGLVEEAAARIALAIANTKLTEALTEARAEQQAAVFREEMLAAVSHDMQTPLSVLLGSLEALRSSPELRVAERDRLYEGMIRQSTLLRRLVHQALDYSRLEAGREIELRIRPTDVDAVLERVGNDVSGRWPLEVDVEPGLPQALVDAERLEQVLANLLSNATKFSTPGSPITVTSRARGDTVEIVVADRGVGMSPGDLAQAFEKFHRGRSAAGQPGAGLGLYMSRALLEVQGGHIGVTSRAGRGTRFTVTVPAATDSPPDVPRSRRAAPRAR